MIEQQYYTRERGGLFSQTDGYDTVAKSLQLKLDYIKKALHPLCSYDIPSELQARGEQDENCYPPNMIVMPGLSGELIVGQAVYKAKDFTGLRSTFFMHNLLLSENEKRRFMKEPEKLFAITGFKTSFDISEGRQLPTLAGVPYDANNPYFIERERLFSKLEISQKLFHKLIAATFISVNSKKKIFIVLDVAIEELGPMAKALLYHLYVALPWSITEKLGICTYANKAETKKNIHITFLDKKTLRQESKSGKDLIFDFVNKKYPTIDEDIESEPYIRTGLDYTKNKMAWEKINHWAEVLSTAFKEPSECGISFYGRVVNLFEMSLCLRAGRLYDISAPKVRKGLLKQVLMYLQSNIADDIRKELLDIMSYCIELVQREIKEGKLISEEELKMILSFKLEYCRNREQEEHCIQILVYLLAISSRQNDYNYVYNVLNIVHNYPKAYIHLFEVLCMHEELKKQVVYYLINDSFSNVKIFDDLVEQMARFEEVEFALIKDQYYMQVVYDKFAICVKAVKDLVSFLDRLQKWSKAHEREIYKNLLEEGEYYFLEHIQLKNIESERTMCRLKFSRSYPLENYEIITGYQKLKTDLSSMSPTKIRVNNKIQELIKIYYKQKVTKHDFYLLVYAFMELDEASHKPRLNLEHVLSYLKDIQMKIMLEFIIWAKDQEMYIDKSKFDSQVIQFCINLKEKEGKINKELIRTLLGEHKKTKVLSEKIIEALKPNLVKWLGKHGIVVGISLAIILAIGGGVGVYFYNQSQPVSSNTPLKERTATPEIIAKLMPDYTEDREEIRVWLEKRLGTVRKEGSE